jgi:hypothetical protein
VVTRFPFTVPDVVERSRDLAQKVLPQLRARAAFLGGAPFAGLGTPTSDVDLHVVVDGAPERGGEQLLVDGARVDVRYWSEQQLTDAVDLCTDYRFSEDEPAQLNMLSRRMIDLIVRFTLGDVVVDDGVLAKLAQRVTVGQDQLIKMIVAIHAVDAENRVEDAKGFAAMSEPGAAGFISRQALMLAAEAALAARGDIYLGPKWIWTRWRRTIGDSFGADVRDLVLGSQRTVDDNGLSQLWLAQDLLVHAVSGYSYPILTAAPDGRPRRTPYATPIPTTTAVLVARTGRNATRLSRQGALLWGVAHGRTRDDAVHQTRTVLSASGTDVPVDDVATYYDSLCASGLVEPAVHDG